MLGERWNCMHAARTIKRSGSRKRMHRPLRARSETRSSRKNIFGVAPSTGNARGVHRISIRRRADAVRASFLATRPSWRLTDPQVATTLDLFMDSRKRTVSLALAVLLVPLAGLQAAAADE